MLFVLNVRLGPGLNERKKREITDFQCDLIHLDPTACNIFYDTENLISLSQWCEISIPYKPYGTHRHPGSQLLSERTITASSALTISPDDLHRFT